MRSFVSLYVATVREFVRDFSALFWTLAFPIMFILIFGVVFSNESDISFDLGLVNQDGAAGERLVEGFQSIEAFDVTTGEEDDEIAALEDGDRSAVIVIPAGTGAAMTGAAVPLTTADASGAPPAGSPADGAGAVLQVYYDPANQSTAQIVLNIIDQVIGQMNAEITGVTPVLTMESQTVSADDLRSIDYLLPGVLAMSLMQLGLFGTAGVLVALRERQVLRRMGATPLSRTTLLASQVAFRLTTALIQTGVIILMGALAFDVHIEYSNLPAIIGLVILGAATFITLGYLMSALAKTEEAVQGIISLPNFLFMFLSGIFFPVDMMPDWIQPVVDVIPLTYLGDALRKTMIDAGSYYSMTRNIAILGVWLVVCGVLAVRLFKWEPQA